MGALTVFNFDELSFSTISTGYASFLDGSEDSQQNVAENEERCAGAAAESMDTANELTTFRHEISVINYLKNPLILVDE